MYIYTAKDLNRSPARDARYDVDSFIADRSASGAQAAELRFLNAVAGFEPALSVGRAYIEAIEGKIKLPNVGPSTMAHMAALCEPHVYHHCGAGSV